MSDGEDLRLEYAAVGQQLAAILRGEAESPSERAKLCGESDKLETELQANQCCLEFFSDWPEEMQPVCWKQLDQATLERTN